jgi:hypothetical protein
VGVGLVADEDPVVHLIERGGRDLDGDVAGFGVGGDLGADDGLDGGVVRPADRGGRVGVEDGVGVVEALGEGDDGVPGDRVGGADRIDDRDLLLPVQRVTGGLWRRG